MSLVLPLPALNSGKQLHLLRSTDTMRDSYHWANPEFVYANYRITLNI